jgi:predicted phage tail protein
MRHKIYLHGYLSGLCPSPVEIEAYTVADAIKILCASTGKALQPNAVTGRHQIKVVGFETAESLYAPCSASDLHLVPNFAGGKSGGFQVILGVVIIAAAVVLSPFTMGGSAVLGASMATSIALTGASMALGGLLQLVSPAPKLNALASSGASTGSAYLSASQNTVAIGTRIPVLVGRFPISGQYISFNIVAAGVPSLTTNLTAPDPTYTVKN